MTPRWLKLLWLYLEQRWMHPDRARLLLPNGPPAFRMTQPADPRKARRTLRQAHRVFFAARKLEA